MLIATQSRSHFSQKEKGVHLRRIASCWGRFGGFDTLEVLGMGEWHCHRLKWLTMCENEERPAIIDVTACSQKLTSLPAHKN